jgi:transcription termination factor Rho
MENLVADELFEDLAPGGSALGVGEDVSDVNSESVLNSMGLKELRELAKQKGVAGTKNLRKHELVAAIRASKTNVTPFEIREGTLELN